MGFLIPPLEARIVYRQPGRQVQEMHEKRVTRFACIFWITASWRGRQGGWLMFVYDLLKALLAFARCSGVILRVAESGENVAGRVAWAASPVPPFLNKDLWETGRFAANLH
jgi:hypothetical protein